MALAFRPHGERHRLGIWGEPPHLQVWRASPMIRASCRTDRSSTRAPTLRLRSASCSSSGRGRRPLGLRQGLVRAGRLRLPTREHLSVDPCATAVWLRLAEQQAEALELAEFTAQRFAELLPRLRDLTLLANDEEALDLLQRRCAAVKVAVVLVREVAGARQRSRTVASPSHPLIAISGRYRYADSLWFSLFHEAAYVVHHPKRETYIHLNQTGDDADGLQTEADSAAAGSFRIGSNSGSNRPQKRP